MLDNEDSSGTSAVVAAVAGMIAKLVASDPARLDILSEWASQQSGGGLGDSVYIRRAVLAVIAHNGDGAYSVLERRLSQFGDPIYIKHSPIIQQEGMLRPRRQ